jgi:hypothetical protein
MTDRKTNVGSPSLEHIILNPCLTERGNFHIRKITTASMKSTTN